MADGRFLKEAAFEGKFSKKQSWHELEESAWSLNRGTGERAGFQFSTKKSPSIKHQGRLRSPV